MKLTGLSVWAFGMAIELQNLLHVLRGLTPQRVVLEDRWNNNAPTINIGRRKRKLCVLSQKRRKVGEGGRPVDFRATTVSNAFLSEKLWYVLQVLHCSPINIQRMHRVSAVFIWRLT